jgi:hypothetical protein
MGRTDSSSSPRGDAPLTDPTSGAVPADVRSSPEGSPVSEPPVEAGHHDFEAQKRIHQQIRNDPDYDDWEYGTEPLPHEAWSAATSKRTATGEPTKD